MRIIVSQQSNKLMVNFQEGSIADSYYIDKADNFIGAIDKLLKKRNTTLSSVVKAKLNFENAGMLTERIIRAIIAGLQL